jgi:hypothetical protein
MFVQLLSCCGIKELAGIGNDLYDRSFDTIVRTARAYPAAFYLFSLTEYQDRTSVEAFEEFLKANNLGTLTASGEKRNPNSGASLKMWIWEPPSRDALTRYCYPKPDKKATAARRAAALKGWATRRRMARTR